MEYQDAFHTLPNPRLPQSACVHPFAMNDSARRAVNLTEMHFICSCTRRVLERAADRTRVELVPVSGRSHQLVSGRSGRQGIPAHRNMVGPTIVAGIAFTKRIRKCSLFPAEKSPRGKRSSAVLRFSCNDELCIAIPSIDSCCSVVRLTRREFVFKLGFQRVECVV